MKEVVTFTTPSFSQGRKWLCSPEGTYSVKDVFTSWS